MTQKRLADLLFEEPQKTTEVAAEPVPTSPRKRLPTKADLEATITELQLALAQREEQLQTLDGVREQQVQHASISNLQAQLEQVQKEALQLAQANTRLTLELTALKKENEMLKSGGPKSIRPPLPLPPAMPADPIWLL
ncbi:hypothetical protein [Anthocerotibacter panamensis]|uniref:hypothetical protein n=1 Tax=Anthocerotibacter panamensis TaxID=2857077 RepID=UPI001C403FE8|nr:hypothetical protein [Anthocerotibacter panamensis]